MLDLADPRLQQIMQIVQTPFERIEHVKSHTQGHGWKGLQGPFTVSLYAKGKSQITRHGRPLMVAYLPVAEILGRQAFEHDETFPQDGLRVLQHTLSQDALTDAASLYQHLQARIFAQGQEEMELYRWGKTFSDHESLLKPLHFSHLPKYFGCFVQNHGKALLAQWMHVIVSVPATQHARLQMLQQTQKAWVPQLGKNTHEP